MLIIIDGYNFILTVPELEKRVEVGHIESMRDYIISLFSRYREKRRFGITVVFDGNYTEASLPKKQSHFGITVIYSKTGINADTEIKNITDLCQNPKDVCIVTYDNDIKRHVKKCGCRVIEPRAMYREMLDTLGGGRAAKSDEPDGKRNGPSERDATYWKGVFKDLPEEEQKPHTGKTVMPQIEKKKSKPSPTIDEPDCKYQGAPSDEAHYWVRVFTGDKKD